MSFEKMINLAQPQKLFLLKIAAHRERGVESWTRVSFRENKTVAIIPARRSRTQIKFIEVEHGKHVRRRERATRVPRACGVDHSQRMHANRLSDPCESRVGHREDRTAFSHRTW